jgi:hypothetical protein
LPGVNALAAGSTVPLDADRGVVQPSAPREGLWRLHRADSGWQVDDWTVTPDDLKRTELALAIFQAAPPRQSSAVEVNRELHRRGREGWAVEGCALRM